MNTCIIVPSAGTGSRMNNRIKKPYLKINGLPVLAHTLRAFSCLPMVKQIIVPVFPGEEGQCRHDVLEKVTIEPEPHVIAGGKTRQDSVWNALEIVDPDCEVVLVHDGARPFITRLQVQECIKTTAVKQATTMAVPVKDTISVVSETDKEVVETIPRRFLFAIQTPQTFMKQVIINAHRKARDDEFNGTDDASLVQRCGIPVTVIPGSYSNIKITTREDLLFAETLINNGWQP